MKDTCVFSVIFPGNLPYFREYLLSLKNQDCNAFDIVLLNDGIDELELEKSLMEFRQYFSIYSFVSHGTIASIRSHGLRLLLDSSYKYIVFADTDDYFLPNRVSLCRKYLEEYDFVVNDLTPFYTENNTVKVIESQYLSNRLNNDQIIESKDLVKHNFIGLGNTAMRKEALISMEIPKDLIAVDWFIFTLILLSGVQGIFTNQTTTFYRQHNANTVGFQAINKEKILKSLQIKKTHYSYLKDKSKVIYDEYLKIIELEKFLTGNKTEEYINQVKKTISSYPLWWEEAKTLDELYEKDAINA